MKPMRIPLIRKFVTGATRASEEGKLDPEGFLSPRVIERYSQYLHKHRLTPLGYRDSDDWQRGIPLSVYMKSAWRHFLSWWKWHRGAGPTADGCGLEDSICALIFNAMGYLHEVLKGKAPLHCPECGCSMGAVETEPNPRKHIFACVNSSCSLVGRRFIYPDPLNARPTNP